jgi:hypothetical protein
LGQIAAYDMREVDAEHFDAIPAYVFPRVSACALPLPPDSPKPVLLLRSCPLKNAPPVVLPEFPAFSMSKTEGIRLEELSAIPPSPRSALETSSLTVSMNSSTSSKVSLESFTAHQPYAATK